MNSYIDKLNTKRLFFFVIILFCINPLGGIIITTFFLLQDKNILNRNVLLSYLFIMLAIYMGLLNATKVPASDQIQYMNAYMLIPKQTIWESLTNIYGINYSGEGTTKEMGYGLLNIIGYVTSFGYYPLFILEFTVLMYMFCFKSIKRLFDAIRPSNSLTLTIAACYIMCFFSQYFNLTIHLQRQEIATTVMLVGIVDYCVSEKYTWKQFIVPVLAMTLHTSVGLFLPLFLIRKLCKDRITKTKLLAILGVIIALITTSVVIASSLLSSLGGDLYALDRLSNAGSSTENSFNYNFLLAFTVPLLFIAIKNILSKSKVDRTKENLFYIFYLELAFFYLLTPDATMQYRYFMMSYSFWPFIIPLAFRRQSMAESVTLTSICVFLFFRFFLTFEDMAWHYTSLENALTCNVISLFLKNPF